ncbi:MAG: hypothetical protein HQ568_06240, partial [Calditrichaeota bacterium]|nr:hypothetical protein [Calditrichota bacterium]
MFTYLTTILLVVSITAQGDNLPVGGGIQEQKYVVSDSLTIIISDPWLLAGSLELLLDDSLLSPEIDYLYEDSQRLITFLPNTRALPDDFITVKYISVAVTDSLHYQRFYLTKPNFFTEQLDSATYKKQTRPVSPFSSWQGMRRSGSITRGVRFGGGSDGGVTSGLHLELSGSPKLGVNVQAIIDDRNMPATRSGSSTSLAELDKLLFQVTTPHLKARLGDWDLVWDNGRYTTFERRLKGGNIAVDYDAFSSDVAAGGGNNTFNTSSLRGRDGDLGPYELTDKNGVPGITVISGSEKVYLNGSLLKRGRRADYVIDYSRGRITFNPRHPIRSDSRIEVEYEYSDDIYPRYFYAASGRVPAGDGSGLSFSTAIISEGRDKENPLAFEWTEERRRALEAVGDDPYSAVVPGIDSVGADQGDYVWGTADDDSIVVFSQPDSLGHPTGYLDVVFSQQSGGGYTRIYEDSLQAFYYEWVGAGVGDWAPVQRLPLPDKTDIVDVITNYKTDRLMMSVEAAFSSYDRNTLSSLNDDDNNGAAWLWNGMWNADDAKNLTLQASVRHEDERFHHINRSSEVDYSYNWNLPEDSVSSVTEVNSNGSFSPRKSVRLSVSGGYLESGSHYRGSRLGVGSVWDLKRFSLSSSVDRTDGDNKLTNVTNQRLRAFGSAYRKTGSLRPSYSVGLEKNQVGGAAPLGGNQFVEHASGIEINLTSRQQLDLCFNYRSDDKLSGSGTKRFSDTRSLNGDWRVKGLPWGGLSLNMLRYYQTYSDASLKSITSTAAGMETAIAPPKSQWRLKVNYNLVTGSDRGSVQVANYVGDGSGGYRR